jgi:hypothetical protein
MLVLRLTSIFGESGICLGHSTFEQQCVLLMSFKIEDSLSNRKLDGSFILIFFMARDGGGSGYDSEGLRRRRALDAPIMVLCVILFSFNSTWSGNGL